MSYFQECEKRLWQMEPWKNPVAKFTDPDDTPYEFQWKPNRNYCLTAKRMNLFECEEATNYEDEDNKFLPFALRKEGLYVLRYYKTEDGPDKAKVWENCPFGMNLFLWDREGNCVNGAY